MMKAIKNFMNKPVTWGDSFKWSGIVLGLYAAVIGACVAYEKWTDYKAEKEMLKKIQFRDSHDPKPLLGFHRHHKSLINSLPQYS